jgi:hypothetical protein
MFVLERQGTCENILDAPGNATHLETSSIKGHGTLCFYLFKERNTCVLCCQKMKRRCIKGFAYASLSNNDIACTPACIFHPLVAL